MRIFLLIFFAFLSLNSAYSAEENDTTVSDDAACRLFLAPSGKPMPASSSNLALYYLAPSYSCGITNWMSATIGINAGLFGNLMFNPLSFGDLDIAIGTIYMKPFFQTTVKNYMAPYCLFAYGNRSNCLTIGTGYMPVNDNRSAAVFIAGGQLQFAMHWKLVSENWFVKTKYDFVHAYSGGIRYFFSGFSVDAFVATIFSNDEQVFVPFPIVLFTIGL